MVFGFEDLVNGIGGALGLFLGWSLLQVLLEGYKHIKIIWNCLDKMIGRVKSCAVKVKPEPSIVYQS